MANYGDVALGLKPDWDRSRYENQNEWVLSTVGHKEGVADVYLTKDKDKRHQFYWADPKDENDVTMARMRGYEFVNKSTWTKRDILWSWNASDHIWYAGTELMARDGERFFADQKRRDQIASKRSFDSPRVPDGLVATEDGKRTNQRYGI